MKFLITSIKTLFHIFNKNPPNLLSVSQALNVIILLLKDISNMALELKEKKVPFQLNVPEELDKRFREYVYRKHHEYRKGLFAEELQIALNNLLDSEDKE
jgi:hypothetical protein